MDKNWADKPVKVKTRGDILHEQAERLGQKIEVPKKHLIVRRHPNRSITGDVIIYLLLALVAVAMLFPLVFLLGSSLKPLDELFRFPPPVWPTRPTMDNFSDLFVTMGQSWVPFSRYLVNTIFITVVGTFGHLVIAGMAAFVLAKYDFPGGRLFFLLATTFLMFASGVVTDIPNYLIMRRLGLVDTYWALILPAFAAPIGLFLMKQFMEGLPTALIEAATIDGAGRFRVFWSIVMPNVKPAWLTMIIFSVQSLWNNPAGTIIYSEAKKPLVYALQQIQGGAAVNIARTGQVAAANVIIVAVPVLIFIFSQSRILETMASSGIKD
ncbi:carbohydrate ABC transporter permease [Aristaeella hokkaidonensis]|uniref:Carbohydrate ABC transporter permease n=2 Tax=Aristaeella hokkaidonensis TaxID=3046382 RepID=A0AC61MZH3_9FIRM|nr:carbohydrate ABC transporter permease [Aristaeella hokkaidonensis]